jgi:hypothetical protein
MSNVTQVVEAAEPRNPIDLGQHLDAAIPE